MHSLPALDACNQIMTDEFYMQIAINEAQKAYNIQESPIGAIIVYKDKIIGKGYNRRNIDKNPLAHGELFAIKEASEYLGDWRLEECTMYVTLEPCPMCAGAIVQSRIPKVVIGAPNYKSGSAGSIIDILNVSGFNHQVEVLKGVLEEESRLLLKTFFSSLRQRNEKNMEIPI